MRGSVLCLVGAQYGSEGKGVVAAYLADRYSVHVRVGGPNAGHTFKHEGRLWKMRALPCGWKNPDAKLVIGAGAIVDPELLIQEITETGVDPARVWVDHRAVVIEETDRPQHYALKARIGATGEGVGPARMRRLARNSDNMRTVGDLPEGFYPWQVADTASLLNGFYRSGRRILLEGTQGYGLSLIHGLWPYVTSHDTGAAQLLADVGLPPTGAEVLMVARTFPIRVGGNSGPLKDETDWDEISRIAGRQTIEHTTVTGRVRRVGWLDVDMLRRSLEQNGAHGLVLTFLDYMYPDARGVSVWRALPDEAQAFVLGLEASLGVNIVAIGTGGPDFAIIERD